MGFVEVIVAVGAVASAIGGLVAFLKWHQAKEAGRTEAQLKAAEREAERGKKRKKVDAEVGGLAPDKLERLLRDNRD